MNLNLKPYLTIMLLLFCLHNKTQAQTTTLKTDSVKSVRAQNFFAEILGPGIGLSLNYDSRFSNRLDGFGGRAGVGYLAVDDAGLLTVPLQLNYLLGDKGKYFEMGIGATFFTVKDYYDSFLGPDGTSSFLGTMTFGYRYQPVGGGFSFRGSINPIFNSHSFVPYFFGISLGYTFKN